MKRFNLENKIMFSIFLTSFLAIILSTGLLKVYMDDQNMDEQKASLETLGKELAIDPVVIAGLTEESEKESLILYTNKLVELLSIDFIVVMDTDFRRLTHPVTERIGEKFSSDDPKRALKGESYFTKNKGVLGNGFRYFTPVYSKNTDEIIGIICIGKTTQTIQTENSRLLNRMYLAVILGIIIVVTPIAWIFRDFKRQADGETIDDILFNHMEQVKVWDSLDEAILAVDLQGRVIFSNQMFKETFDLALQKKGQNLFLKTNVYQELFFQTESQTDIPFFFEKKEYQYNSYPIIEKNEIIGYIATISDKQTYKQLQLELTGAKQYVTSLRSQSHEFFNKMHIINALIELGRYEEARQFIGNLQGEHQEQIGQLSTQIQTPLVAGTLLSKMKEAKENNVTLRITSDSFLGNHDINKRLYDYLQVLSILIDNAIEACAEVEAGQIAITISDDRRDNQLMATVSNNGPTILVDPISDIYKKGLSTRGVYRGFGMYLVKGIVERNQGEIEVESNEEQTTFTFILRQEESETE